MLPKENLSIILVLSICCLIFTAGCGSDPCSNINCPDICNGEELWAQVCEKGQCIYYKQISDCSTICGCASQLTTTTQNTVTNNNTVVPPQDTIKNKPETGDKDIIVYKTNTGTKYHRAGCQHIKKSSIPITLAEAKAQGLTPCKVCKPPI